MVSVPPKDIRAMRDAISRRRHFVKVRTAQVNAVKFLLRSAGKEVLARSLRAEAGWNRLMAALSDAPALQAHVLQHRALWRCAREQIESLEHEVRELGRPWKKELDLLDSIPGVGTIVASTALAISWITVSLSASPIRFINASAAIPGTSCLHAPDVGVRKSVRNFVPSPAGLHPHIFRCSDHRTHLSLVEVGRFDL